MAHAFKGRPDATHLKKPTALLKPLPRSRCAAHLGSKDCQGLVQVRVGLMPRVSDTLHDPELSGTCGSGACDGQCMNERLRKPEHLRKASCAYMLQAVPMNGRG